MTFNPNKPSSPDNLYALIDDEFDEVVTVMYYEEDEGLFNRIQSQWAEFNPDNEEDIDGLTVINVDPRFIPIYDKSEAENIAISLAEVKEYYSGTER